MNSGLYAAATGLIARSQALDVVANNVANAGSAGYKADLPFYRLVQQAGGGGVNGNALTEAVNSYGALGGSRIRWAEGPLVSTSNPTDIALQGPGLLTVKSRQGIVYTRAGNLHLDVQRRLVTGAGDPVMGSNGEIVVPEGKLSVSETGELAVNGAIFDKLALVEMNEGVHPVKKGDSYFEIAAADCHASKETRVMQGQLESANQTTVEGTVRLITLQRQAEMLERALNVFHNDMNRSAAEEIAKV